MKVWIYRPELGYRKNIILDYLYDENRISFKSWEELRRRQNEKKDIKIEVPRDK